MVNYETISPSELSERLRRGDLLRVIDVREPLEHDLARIDGVELLPLSRFDQWADSLNAEDEFVFVCHHGIRSAQVCSYFAGQGFRKLHNLAGGIDRWSDEVDPRVPKY